MIEEAHTFDETGARRIVDAVRAVERTGAPSSTLQVASGVRDSRTVAARITGAAVNGLYPAKFVGLANTFGTTTTTAAPTTTTSTTTSTTTTSTTAAPTTTTPCPRYRFITTEIQDCWLGLSDHDSLTAQLGDVFSALTMGVHTDGLPIVVHSDSCRASTTTSTTLNCLSGYCLWQFNATTDAWEISEKTCAETCNCQPPLFCPPNEACAITKTSCTINEVQPPINCTGTTTTTSEPTTTTPRPGCGGECTFTGINGAWYRLTNPCQSICPCSYPVGTPADCADTVMPCVPPPPLTCDGTCLWKCFPAFGWTYVSGNCTGTAPGCNCAAPTVACEVCATIAATSCTAPDIDTTPPPATTTTTPAPGLCTGRCYYSCDGTAWVLDSTTCTFCDCSLPSTSSCVTCEVAETRCTGGTTTTSTTTIAPTTTTTTEGPTTTTTAGPTTTTTTTTTEGPTTTAEPDCNKVCTAWCKSDTGYLWSQTTGNACITGGCNWCDIAQLGAPCPPQMSDYSVTGVCNDGSGGGTTSTTTAVP